MQAWRTRADDAIADLSGRTPGLLVALLDRRVAVSAQEAAEAAGVSVSAAQRSLTLMAERGLAREIAGKGRFRASGRASEAGRPQGGHVRAPPRTDRAPPRRRAMLDQSQGAQRP